MPARINILERVIQAIAVSIQGLRILVVLHYGIRAYEPAYRRIIISSVVVVQAGIVQPLAGKQLVRIYSPLTISTDSKGATLVFYPHGNLVLATGWAGREEKISRDQDARLLIRILSQWDMNHYTPLFISEGNTEQKHLAIGRSDYLNVVYNKALKGMGNSLVIYGWAFRDQDTHILKALDRQQPARIAVSVYMQNPEWQDYCNHVKTAIDSCHNLKHCHLDFFDSDSDELWTKCTSFQQMP